MRLTEKIAQVERDLIKYKTETSSTADTSPLYRKVIRFEPFGDEYTTRFYKIRLFLDTKSPIVEPSVSYLQPFIPNYGVPVHWLSDINLTDNTLILATQAGNFTMVVTVYSSAEIKGYETNYTEIRQ